MFKSFRIAVLLTGALFAAAALAQPDPNAPPQGGDQADPSSRVGRLSFIRGAVSFVPAGENEWVEAQINRPLITGDKLWTDHDSRAELEIGPAAIRIDEQTSFDFLNLDDQTAQVELTQGALNLRVRRLYDNQVYEIDTPTLAFVANRVGEYRVSVTPDGRATIVSVLSGGGDAYGENGARFRIEEGQSVTFNDSQLRDYYTDALPRPDAFDQFCRERNGRWDHARSREYVSEDVIGYQDLDDNGDWADVPEYGHVWYPTTVAVGWTPYHYGHWGWVGAYGWTWIDDAPWGFAPFHYGRWAYVGGRWGWCPGPIAVRPYYAPALVAFIGGAGVGVGVAVGGPVGWFPLGPRDVYFPGYHVSQHYFTSVNVSNTVVNTTVINNYYGGYSRGTINYGEVNFHNRAVAGAVVAVPAAAFVSARPVHTAAIAVNRDTFANAHVSSFAAVAPTRASLVATPAARAGARPPATVEERKIVAATRPPPPPPSFAAREAVLQKNPGQPLSNAQLRSLPAVQNNGRGAEGNGRGAEARNVAAAERANVKVVTNNGVPALTAAAPIIPRPVAGNANGNGRREGLQGNAVNNAAGNNNAGGNRTVEERRGNNPADNRNAVTGNAAGNGQSNAGANGRGQAQQNPQHLDSSRFVHGNEGGNGQNNGGRGQQGNGQQGGGQQGNNARQSINATGAGQPQGNTGSGNSNAGQGNGRGNGPQEHSYRSPQTGQDNAAQNARNEQAQNAAKAQQQQQERYQQQQQQQERVQHDRAVQQQQQQQQQQRAIQQQQQQQERAVQQQHQQQERAIQQQQQAQERVQQQQHAPPQPQYQPPPQQQQQSRGQPQQQQQHQNQNQNQGNRGGDKHNKDDDKKNGGGR